MGDWREVLTLLIGDFVPTVHDMDIPGMLMPCIHLGVDILVMLSTSTFPFSVPSKLLSGWRHYSSACCKPFVLNADA